MNKSIVGIIFLLLCLLVPIIAAFATGPIRCDYCKQIITTGSYIEVDGKYYHPHHFLCANCNNSIGQSAYYEKDGQYYDSLCYFKLFVPTCAYCGKPITGKVIEYQGQKYDEQCFTQHLALRCTLCGDIINGDYMVDFWGNAIHRYHIGKEPQCEYCGRFISPTISNGGQTYSDGRVICGLCAGSAMSSLSEAKATMSAVKNALSGIGITIDDEGIPLTLIDRDQLNRLDQGERTGKLEGYTYYRSYGKPGGPPQSREFSISILTGMPRLRFIFAMAHELMHVWIFTNAPRETDPALSEGSCNYAAYLVLQMFDSKEADFMRQMIMQNDDPLYGDGFRRVKEFAEKVGLTGWLNYLQHNQRPPW
ncbi:MAG: protein DA1 [candidate division Zixibacteria bacterium]|nr:protein DA1 [candidate division Zixibacteria bacterium]